MGCAASLFSRENLRRCEKSQRELSRILEEITTASGRDSWIFFRQNRLVRLAIPLLEKSKFRRGMVS
ncbi:MAG: hypothetical protein DWI02_03515 [Planctomycetota bacterium]|nr:MAG: hypothetical protein DWI02_03515 [Planctomycetota bacterium]